MASREDLRPEPGTAAVSVARLPIGADAGCRARYAESFAAKVVPGPLPPTPRGRIMFNVVGIPLIGSLSPSDPPLTPSSDRGKTFTGDLLWAQRCVGHGENTQDIPQAGVFKLSAAQVARDQCSLFCFAVYHTSTL